MKGIKYNYPEMKEGLRLGTWLYERIQDIDKSDRGLSHFKVIDEPPNTFGHYVISYLERCLQCS